MLVCDPSALEAETGEIIAGYLVHMASSKPDIHIHTYVHTCTHTHTE